MKQICSPTTSGNCIAELSDLLLTYETNETYIVMASYEGLGAVQWGVLGQLRTFQTNGSSNVG